MTTLSTRERDRRGRQYVLGVVTILAVIATFVVHRHVLSGNPLAFWLPTVAGFAYGSTLWFLGSRRASRWLSNLTMAGWLGIFLVLLGTKVVSGPAWFMAVMIGALAVTAAFPQKPAPSTVEKIPAADVRPWSGSGVTAELTEHDFGRRALPAVNVTTKDGAAGFLVADLAGHFDGEQGIAESVSGQLAFLTRVGLASPDSIIGEATTGLPEGTLVLHSAKEEARPSAVFAPADAAAFEHWVRTLPEG
jgi:hypothetical protein